jgi:hypothetical protein
VYFTAISLVSSVQDRFVFLLAIHSAINQITFALHLQYFHFGFDAAGCILLVLASCSVSAKQSINEYL